MDTKIQDSRFNQLYYPSRELLCSVSDYMKKQEAKPSQPSPQYFNYCLMYVLIWLDFWHCKLFSQYNRPFVVPLAFLNSPEFYQRSFPFRTFDDVINQYQWRNFPSIFFYCVSGSISKTVIMSNLYFNFYQILYSHST